MKTALPLYLYPADGEPNWAAAIQAGGTNVGFIIANINSGPGAAPQAEWSAVINHAIANGIAIYGYVYSHWGVRDAAALEADVSAWLQFYPNITGIFIDEAASDTAHLPYYKARYDYIKSLNSTLRVVINPGTPTDEGYMTACDINTIFEADYNTWLTSTFPAWAANYPEDRFYAIVYGVPGQAEMEQVVQSAKTRNFGHVYVTDARTASAPLPPDFNAELVVVAAQRTVPGRSTAPGEPPGPPPHHAASAAVAYIPPELQSRATLSIPASLPAADPNGVAAVAVTPIALASAGVIKVASSDSAPPMPPEAIGVTAPGVAPAARQALAFREYSAPQVSSSTAMITWSTSVPSTGQVIFASSPDDLTSVSDDHVGTLHTVRLENLPPDTIFSFQINAQSADWTETALSPMAFFQTQN